MPRSGLFAIGGRCQDAPVGFFIQKSTEEVLPSSHSERTQKFAAHSKGRISIFEQGHINLKPQCAVISLTPCFSGVLVTDLTS
jgi:hypothetical protein